MTFFVQVYTNEYVILVNSVSPVQYSPVNIVPSVDLVHYSLLTSEYSPVNGAHV